MQKQDAIIEAAKLLASAAYTRSPSTDEAWDYGWSVESYRRSGRAAVGSDRGEIVTFSNIGIESLERAVRIVFSVQNVARLYDEPDVWVLVSSLCASVPVSPEREQRVQQLIAERLLMIAEPPISKVVLPIANTSAEQTPITLAGLTIGLSADPTSQSLREEIEPTVAGHRMKPWWTEKSENALILVYAGPEQVGRAVRYAERRFEDVVASALMFEEDLDGRKLFSLRGDSHRPGVRGLAIDRRYLSEVAKTNPAIFRELGAPVVVTSRFGTRLSQRWFGEPPFPLGDLLAPAGRREEVETVALSETDCFRRLATAARWHAKAYWSSTVDDAVLALGVAFDAMFSEPNPSPGRVLAERFALLSGDANVRKERYRKFQSRIYPARSAVAHGARRSAVDVNFVRDIARDARLAFRQIFELVSKTNSKTEHDYNELFEELKWAGPPTPRAV